MEAVFRKSSYSTDRGECVEIAVLPASPAWRTSSYTNANSNNCVEVAAFPASSAFRKSTYSQAEGQDCVEVADAPRVSAMRDTKHRDLGALLFPSPEWRAFLDAAKRDAF
ncbi:DUF397 domain-containing protein [Nocardiopsis potens]|uniref:DUF397 domain-containing protein n=1 Tax=Nocardiopsis potens TaxID=1246458 RepID=UPI000347B145|nr:DUF397 domain-containing protein [Nocardiopsis potens]